MAAHRIIDIRFRKHGRIDLSSSLVKELEVHNGDSIDVFFDTENRELYLYVKYKKESISNKCAKYTNVAKSVSKNFNSMRVQSIELTHFVNKLTNSEESWLFVGSKKFVNTLNANAMPIIYLNNQFKNEQTL